MKNAVFWDVTPCGSCKNRCFLEERVATILRVTTIGEVGTLAVTSNIIFLRNLWPLARFSDHKTKEAVTNGIELHVICGKSSYVSEEHVTSIFSVRVMGQGRQLEGDRRFHNGHRENLKVLHRPQFHSPSFC
jgi:hypothetical protein